MGILIISCSLNLQSTSHVLGTTLHKMLATDGHSVEHVRLSDHPLPLCDAYTSFSDPNADFLSGKIAGADAIVLTVPIYNYDVNAAAKNLIELTGKAWRNKVIGFACSAGGHGSYMSVMGIANSMMLDFRCLVVPRFVYAIGAAFKENEIVDTAILDRLRDLGDTTVKLAGVLK